jgi:hypothetical protein
VDQFTRIANGLFRDSRISYKAKGALRLQQHSPDGWQVTVAALVALITHSIQAVSRNRCSSTRT